MPETPWHLKNTTTGTVCATLSAPSVLIVKVLPQTTTTATTLFAPTLH